MKKIILASASPRRKKLLTLAGIDFTVSAVDADETLPQDIAPDEAVVTLSKRKAHAAAELYEDAVIIGADTVVAVDGKILGKPQNADEAYTMLSSLSGKSHYVFTGVCITDGEKEISFYEKTEVTFFNLTDEEINAYIATGDCFDKAGAYGIQSKGCTLVKKISGDYFNVVGLPIAETVRKLKHFN